MPAKDHYLTVARQIADYLNNFKLAFKTYKVSEFDDMLQTISGAGSRISSDTASREFSGLLLERGFLIFPPIDSATDGYVRVYRSGTVIANLLSAFRYPGTNGDSDLASLLRTLQQRRRPDDFAPSEGGE